MDRAAPPGAGDGGEAHGHEARLPEYQRNAAFVGFMLFVCTAALVYLMKSLTAVLVPLLWAAFFAMPLTGFIDVVNPLIINAFRSGISCCYSSLRRRLAQEPIPREGRDVVSFNAAAGETHIRVRAVDRDHLLRRVSEVGGTLCNPRFRHLFRSCCQRRVRVVELQAFRLGDEVSPAQRTSLRDERKVNRIVKGWLYYVRECRAQPQSGDEARVDDDTQHLEACLALYLDQDEHYPAVAVPQQGGPMLRGKLEVDDTHIVSYAASVVIALVFIFVTVFIFVWLIAYGSLAVKKSVAAYVKGGKEFLDWLNTYAQKILPPDITEGMDEKATDFLKEKLPQIASAILDMGGVLSFDAVLFVLYLLFWMVEPLPINRRVSAVFRTYLLQKSLVCLIFASLVSLLLLALQCKIWHVLFIVTFLFNYIPEVGPIVCFCIMLPLILLDGNLTMSTRTLNATWFIVVFWGFKFLTGNIIEVQLYAKSGGDLMRMHPVVMLALMMLFQELMGITGMFMTVPTMAAAKYYMLTMNMPAQVLDPLLMCLEGSDRGPHINFVESHRANVYAPLYASDCSDEEDRDGSSAETTEQTYSD